MSLLWGEMDTKEFKNSIITVVEKMVASYRHNKEGKVFAEGRIVRGRSVSISSDFELNMAEAILGCLPENYIILIDTPLSYRVSSERRKKTIYPDIMLVKNVEGIEIEVRAIIELKIDLGWFSHEWTIKRNELWQELGTANELFLRQNPVLITDIPGKRPIPDYIVVLTKQNDHGRWEEFKSAHPNNNSLLLKDKYEHPNSDNAHSPQEYRDQLLKDSDFESQCNSLYKFISQCVS